MSLVAGPGRGGAADGMLPDELSLVIEKHVAYIQSLDTVCDLSCYIFLVLLLTLTDTVAQR